MSSGKCTILMIFFFWGLQAFLTANKPYSKHWRGRRTATKRELQSLIGHLSHAGLVVLPGCVFLRRMIDLMKVAKLPSHHVRLTSDFKSDLQWWPSFLPGWNGQLILPQPDPSSHQMRLARGVMVQCQTQVNSFRCHGLNPGRMLILRSKKWFQ